MSQSGSTAFPGHQNKENWEANNKISPEQEEEIQIWHNCDLHKWGMQHSKQVQIIRKVVEVCPCWAAPAHACEELNNITKTCLYNFDPLKPHFYIVKLGFTGAYIIFLLSAQKHILWYSLEPPHRGGPNEYPQSMFWAEIWKNLDFFIWKFSIFWW